MVKYRGEFQWERGGNLRGKFPPIFPPVGIFSPFKTISGGNLKRKVPPRGDLVPTGGNISVSGGNHVPPAKCPILRDERSPGGIFEGFLKKLFYFSFLKKIF